MFWRKTMKLFGAYRESPKEPLDTHTTPLAVQLSVKAEEVARKLVEKAIALLKRSLEEAALSGHTSLEYQLDNDTLPLVVRELCRWTKKAGFKVKSKRAEYYGKRFIVLKVAW